MILPPGCAIITMRRPPPASARGFALPAADGLAGAGGLILFLLKREDPPAGNGTGGQFYLLSHFANTCLFELSYETGGLRLSDNLPTGLDLPPEARSLTGAALFRSLLHEEDWPRVEALYRNPPAAGREAALEFRLRHRTGATYGTSAKSIAIPTATAPP